MGCAAKKQTLLNLLICVSSFPCGLVGAWWVTVNIGGPAIRRVAFLATNVRQKLEASSGESRLTTEMIMAM